MKYTELEQFADSVATEVFTPLWLNDFFWLRRLADSGNMLAYDAFMDELIDKWTVPEEYGKVIVSDTDVELFELMCQEENGGT